jgi:hypothetical protein
VVYRSQEVKQGGGNPRTSEFLFGRAFGGKCGQTTDEFREGNRAVVIGVKDSEYLLQKGGVAKQHCFLKFTEENKNTIAYIIY